MKELIDQLSAISHEFKTPLDVIAATAQFVTKSIDTNQLSSDKLASAMNSIRHYCCRLELLTDNIILMSKASRDAVDLRYTNKNIMSAVQILVENMQAFCTAYQFTLKINNRVKDQDFCCDYNLLESIILNLISNAVKYNNKKKKLVTITLKDTKDSMSISIKDNGIGIDEKAQKKIFDKFYRVSNRNVVSAEGMGLGLSIVKKLTETLRGTIDMKSKLGQGTEFTITLPRDALPTTSLKETDMEIFSKTAIAISLAGINK